MIFTLRKTLWKFQVSDDSLSYIFQAILDWHLTTKGYPVYICKMSPQVIAATLQLYSNVRVEAVSGFLVL